jgi:hypothetical protein
VADAEAVGFELTMTTLRWTMLTSQARRARSLGTLAAAHGTASARRITCSVVVRSCAPTFD